MVIANDCVTESWSHWNKNDKSIGMMGIGKIKAFFPLKQQV